MTKYRPGRISDPLELLPHQSGIIDNPVSEGAAAGNTQLDKQQRAAVIGEPVPIVFCRRTGSGASAIGGVLAEPLCTEGRFVNDSTTNVLTLDFMLVLSEGDMNQLLLKDCFQRSCRVGTWEQTYNRRAGSFVPLYSITTVANKTPWNLPTYVGTSGRYEDMTTIHFSNTYADGSNNALKQVFCFVREGINCARILESNSVGPSNNFIDLAIYLLKTRIPDALIDTTSMTAAATFLNANSLFFNGVFNRSSNLEDYLTSTGNHFLLRLSEKNGKKTFKPRVPTNTDGTIKVTAITPSYNFTEEHIIQGSFQVSYIPIEDRKNCNVQIIYREQPDDDIGIVRTAEIKFDGEASTGPYESHDLSTYCATENHAVKVGSYIAIRKKTITHTTRISVRPSTFNATLELGDIVRVKLRRETEAGLSSHDYFYEIERIEKNTSGLITLDLTHFPIDNQRRSIVALLVNSATGSGALVGTSRTDFTCDVNSRTDTSTALSDVGIDYGSLPVSFDVPSVAEVTTTLNKTSLATAGGASTADGSNFNVDSYDIGGFGSTYNLSASGGVAGEFGADLGDEANATDPLDNELSTSLTDNRSTSRNLRVGDTITATGPTCAGGRILSYHGSRPLNDDGTPNTDSDAIVWDTTPFQTITAGQMSTPGVGIMILSANEIDKMIKWVTECPDESSDTGFGTPTEIGRTDKPIEINVNDYRYARFTGTKTRAIAASDAVTGSSNTVALSSDWTQFNSYDGSGNRTSSDGYLTIAGLNSCSITATFLGNTTDTGAVKGSGSGTAWQSNVNGVQYTQQINVMTSVGGLGVNAAGGGCGGTGFMGWYEYLQGKGSYIRITGKWEFTNDQSAGAQETWEGINSIIENPTDTAYSDYSYG